MLREMDSKVYLLEEKDYNVCLYLLLLSSSLVPSGNIVDFLENIIFLFHLKKNLKTNALFTVRAATTDWLPCYEQFFAANCRISRSKT